MKINVDFSSIQKNLCPNLRGKFALTSNIETDTQKNYCFIIMNAFKVTFIYGYQGVLAPEEM